MTSRIDDIITGILKAEGPQFTNRSTDLGGPTKYGVTQRTLAAHRGHSVTVDDVRNLGEAEARRIYHTRFVVAPGFSHVLSITPTIGEELVDSGVNCGTARASEWLQRCLNVLNRRGSDYPDIRVDGDVGPATLGALRAFLKRRGKAGESALLRALNSLQGAHYITLAERDPRQEDYTFGWLFNRVG